ncbi:hypothetical protein BRD00_08110 [Halobacteriales archaeon QS_8_69_26]|nr:MAG: hypothetical protein BRD00_08110 [Halobacteriales archaeon QS_8_69_26]
MCTLTFAWHVFGEAPLVVAANRDELLDRESRPPERIHDGRAIVAPVDEQAGGTWIGYNDAGLFAGITNRWTADDREGERSRGLLMRDVLGQETAQAATRLVERELDERVYEGFNLVVADGMAAVADPGSYLDPPTPQEREDPVAAMLIEHDGGVHTSILEPGVHVVVNVGADGNYAVPEARPEAGRAQAENADRLRTHLTPEPGETATGWRDRAKAAIRDHEFGVCVHHEERGFGTRSSSVLTFGDGGVRYEYADGPPCTTDYEDVAATVGE